MLTLDRTIEIVGSHTVTKNKTMRTKTTLVAAAILAAGLASSMAQNVYSLNVVGYVNKVIDGGGTYNLLCNPLKNANNNLTNLFSTAAGPQQPSSQILTWDVVNFDFAVVQPSFVAGSWSANVDLSPGKGFFYVNNFSTFTNTFVGEVVQGSVTNLIVGSGSYNCIGSTAPIGGSFTNAIAGLVAGPSDQVFVWDKLTYDFNVIQPAFVAGVWTATVNVAIGEGLFYVNNGFVNKTWVRNFTVQ